MSGPQRVEEWVTTPQGEATLTHLMREADDKSQRDLRAERAWPHRGCRIDRCHRCPGLDGGIMPGCWGMVIYGDLAYCTCDDGKDAKMPERYP